MVKRFVILRKKPSISVEEFRHHWKTVHGPLIASIPGVKRYIQYHIHSDTLDSNESPLDGLAELWFDSEEAQKKAWESEEYKRVVADEPNLFEMNSHCIHPVMTDEVVELV